MQLKEGKSLSDLHFQITVFHWGQSGKELIQELKQIPWRNAAG